MVGNARNGGAGAWSARAASAGGAGSSPWRRTVPQRSRPVFLPVFLLFILVTGISAADPRPVYLEHPAAVVPPRGYMEQRTYPVFVVLPPTGVHSEWTATRLGLDPARQREFILILPEGRPTREEYLPDFLQFVEWYEERLLRDLDRVLEEYNADPERVYLGGYSLGGDLSWALAVRNPDRFAGAIVAGSRASHPVDQDVLNLLRDREFRGSFLIGNREDPNRYRGINVARMRFDDAGVEHRFREYPGGHVMPGTELFQEEIRYITGVDRLPDPGEPALVAGRTGTGLLGHTSRDRIALRLAIPAAVADGDFVVPGDADVRFRFEWPWSRVYLRTTGGYETNAFTTDFRVHRLYQDVLLGVGGLGSSAGALGAGAPRVIYGVGLGWDWWRRFTGNPAGDDDPEEQSTQGGAYETMDVLLMRAVRNHRFIPASRVDPDRVDSLLVLRYGIPRGIGGSVALEQVLNLRAEYLLRIGDRFVVDAGAGTYTVQNRPVESLRDLSEALDHRLQWELGLGVRGPSPLLWRIGYRGIGERPIGGSDYSYGGTWTMTVEYSY